jgi:alpha-ketoglutarate-dependent 2,4-dichlorophenoxyacetate dioxygenase
MAMTITVNSLHPDFFAEIGNVDLRQPVDPETLGEIVAALDTYGVVVFHDQHLSDAQQLAFSALFGPLETSRQTLRPDFKPRLDTHISDVSNLDHQNQLMARDNRRWMQALANRLWHTDSSFKRLQAKYSLLSAHAIPPKGGETQFADMRAAYDALSDEMKQRIENLVAEHSIFNSRATLGFTDFIEEERKGLPPVPHVVVWTHPGSKRKTLYLASHAGRIFGMPVPEGRMLLHDLLEHATQPQFVHTHHWKVGDLVIWDDRCTMHRARDFDMTVPRDMRRTTVSDIATTLEQKGVQMPSEATAA